MLIHLNDYTFCNMKKIGILLGCLLWVFVDFAQSGSNMKSVNAHVYIARYKDEKACAISYTFDDGLKEHYTLVAPQLKRNGFRGTFFVWGKCIENESAAIGKPRMTWAELKKMSMEGHEISNHSWSHPNLTLLSPENLKFEIEKNDSIIFEKLGKMPRTFCYPGNSFNDIVLQAASKNRVDTRTRQFAVGSKSTPESLDHWLEDLIQKGEWGITMVHGITYGYDAFPDAAVLWQHFEKVKALSNKVWVATFLEVAAYIKERENVQLDVTEKKRSIIITPHLFLDKELFTEPLTMVVKQEGIRKVKVKQGRSKLPVSVVPGKVIFNFNPYGGTIQIDCK
jgi:peptidoglycan/xylan/chitin deacetylase (PgdA/CDA1 family)